MPTDAEYFNGFYDGTDSFEFFSDDAADQNDDNPGDTHKVVRQATRRGFAQLLSTMLLGSAGLYAASRLSFGVTAGLAALPVPLTRPRVEAPALPHYAFQATLQDRAEWQAFRQRFVFDGRVIDTGNRNVSHSEGQGWGMLFAVAFDDRQTFDALWSWTERHLRRPDGALHAWRYDPNAATPVTDWNNATDGDISLAAALMRAARRWGDQSYAEAARAIALDIRTNLVRVVGGRTLLLPALYGFEHSDGAIVNPSYYAFPLLAEIAMFDPAPAWGDVIDDGVQLIAASRFGRWNLPPDWLHVDVRDGGISPAPGWPARFSFDAIRVPLYLAWSHLMTTPAREDYRAYWSSRTGVAAWVDLRSNDTAPYAAPAGMKAISQFVTEGGREVEPRVPAIAAAQDYYSAALVLLTRLAWRESGDLSRARLAPTSGI